MKRQLFFLISFIIFALVVGCGGSGGGGGLVDSPEDSTGNGNETADSLNIIKVFVPAGSYIRGSDQGFESEYPAREIYLDAFWISKTEITNNQYVSFLNDGNSDHYYGSMRIYYDGNTFLSYDGYENHPVVHVNYTSALRFAQWAGGRLPTEAEWEKAARGTDARIFPWGDVINSYYADVFRFTQDATTLPVGRFPDYPSPYGALDMTGSVWEWCNDWYNPYYYYPDYSPDSNPPGPDYDSSVQYRVLRGGSFREQAEYLRCSYRYYSLYENHYDNVGFRVAWNN